MLESVTTDFPGVAVLDTNKNNGLPCEFGTNLSHFLKVFGLNHG
jgi:hypothetical protein